MTSRRQFIASTLAAAGALATEGALTYGSIGQTGSLLRKGKTSVTDLTRACLEQIDQWNGTLNAFITVTREAAMRGAEALQAEARAGKWRGPLHGIPVAVKDLYDTAGVKTTAGSKQWADRVPAQDAEVIRRLRSAGAILLGKLNMDEFAYNFTGETSSFGTSRNPWNLKRSPGGSSGGSAVAVAAGMCFAALGSDTGGSIRLPAAFCGITGFKPTYGLVSTEGVAPLAWSLDHVGPMCRSAEDAGLLHGVLAGKPLHIAAVDVRALRIGIPRATFYDGIDRQVESAVGEAAKTLGRIASGTREINLPPLPLSRDIADLPETYLSIIQSEAHAFHEQMLETHPERYHAGTRKSIEAGAAVSSGRYIRALREMNRLRTGADDFFPAVDLLVTPTAPGPAFTFGSGRLVFLRNTAPWNLLGLPSISIPCGFSEDGLPIGLQITGKPGRDDAVIATAAAYQKVTDWHTRRPPMARNA